jgi:gas vesicle protein
MDALLCEISKLKYLPENLVKSLRAVCDERTELEKIVNRYESSAKILIDNIIDRIPAKVGEYRYQMKYSVGARDKGKDLLGLAKDSIRDFISEKKKDGNEVNSAEEPTSKEIREKIKEGIAREDDDALMLERFQSDIEQLISHSRNACGEMAQDCAKNIKQDMEKFADSILKIYFGSIIKEIQGMQTEMSKILEEYYLE